jgi:hypothetical protein
MAHGVLEARPRGRCPRQPKKQNLMPERQKFPWVEGFHNPLD